MTILRRFSETREKEFIGKGYKKRYFFPHKTYCLPRCAPEGFFFANRMWNISDPNSLWEIVLFGTGEALKEFPETLFFDNDIIWHQEHFGIPGQVAAANLIIDNGNLYTLEHISDLVQRIHLRKEYRTRINSHFKHWHHMLLNSILNFAVENDLAKIYSPTADLLIEKFYNGTTKPKVDRHYFDRIYDRDVNMHFDAGQRDGMWVIDVKRNRHKVIVPEREVMPVGGQKVICILHDTEKGLGDLVRESTFAQTADHKTLTTLRRILQIESETDIRTTYNVVGAFLEEVRADIEQDGHCVAFHSYNHQVSRQPVTDYRGEESTTMHLLSKVGYKVTALVNFARRRLSLPPVEYRPFSEMYEKVVNKVRGHLSLPPVVNQLAACRRVDWRIKGYRHYQPELAAALRDDDLCYYNFEWVAIDDGTLGAQPTLQNRVVKIPVFCDDQALYKHNVPYEIWENKILDRIKQSSFTAIGLHDGYAQCWLPHYAKLLAKLSSFGQFKTLNEVADQVFLANAV